MDHFEEQSFRKRIGKIKRRCRQAVEKAEETLARSRQRMKALRPRVTFK